MVHQIISIFTSPASKLKSSGLIHWPSIVYDGRSFTASTSSKTNSRSNWVLVDFKTSWYIKMQKSENLTATKGFYKRANLLTRPKGLHWIPYRRHVSQATEHQAAERPHSTGDQTHSHLAQAVQGNEFQTLKMEHLHEVHSGHHKDQKIQSMPFCREDLAREYYLTVDPTSGLTWMKHWYQQQQKDTPSLISALVLCLEASERNSAPQYKWMIKIKQTRKTAQQVLFIYIKDLYRVVPSKKYKVLQRYESTTPAWMLLLILDGLFSWATTTKKENTLVHNAQTIQHLKSVAGSVPCQPISFHNSDFNGGISRVG